MEKGFPAAAHQSPPAQDVLVALDRLLGNKALRLSERNRKFLSFVVSRTVSGQADRIKAYAIGVDVFGRDESFDPTIDPIVRIEATRLRSALTSYYEEAGGGDRIRIAIPPGSYVPTFSWISRDAESESKSSEGNRAGARQLATIVLSDQSQTPASGPATNAALFADALIRLLSKARCRVLATPPAERFAALQAIQEIFAHPGEAYSLDIAVRPMAECCRYSWRFGDLRNGEVLGCDTTDFALSAEANLDLIDSLADTVAAAIASLLKQH